MHHRLLQKIGNNTRLAVLTSRLAKFIVLCLWAPCAIPPLACCFSKKTCDLSRRRRGSVSTMTPHQYWNVCDWKTTEKDQPSEAQLSLPTCTHRKSAKKHLPTVAIPLSNVGEASFRPFELYTQTKKHTYEKNENPHSEKKNTVPKKSGETRQANSKSERNARTLQTTHLLSNCQPVAHVPSSFIFSHHLCRSPSTVRETAFLL